MPRLPRSAVVACLVTYLASSSLLAQNASPVLLDQVEQKLHEASEQWAYWPKWIHEQWLPDGSGYVMPLDGTQWRFDVESGEKREITKSEKTSLEGRGNRSPDGSRVFEVREGNVFIREIESGEESQITNNKRPEEVSYWGMTWSHDGRSLAFVEEDKSEVRVRTDLLGDEPSYPTLRESRFARVGGKIPKLRVGMVEAESRKLCWAQLEDPDEGFYIGQIEWSRDELSIEYLSRFRDRRWFLLADRESGEVRTIFEESDPAWVVASIGVNRELVWFDGGDRFLVIHERSGWRHAYIHARDGKQLVQLTEGNFDVIERASLDEKGGWFYFYASPENATQKYLFRVPIDGSKAPDPHGVSPGGLGSWVLNSVH